MRQFLIRNQQRIALCIGYVLAFILAFWSGRLSVAIPESPSLQIDESTIVSQPNDNPEIEGLQSGSVNTPSLNPAPTNGDCQGKIKGNVSSSGKIYHVPGGSFYQRTAAEQCFATEAEAQAAGFRKSKR